MFSHFAFKNENIQKDLLNILFYEIRDIEDESRLKVYFVVLEAIIAIADEFEDSRVIDSFLLLSVYQVTLCVDKLLDLFRKNDSFFKFNDMLLDFIFKVDFFNFSMTYLTAIGGLKKPQILYGDKRIYS